MQLEINDTDRYSNEFPRTLVKHGLHKILNQLAKKKATHIVNKFALQKFDWL